MDKDQPETKVDRWVKAMKNHRILAVVIIVGICVIAVGNFTDALTKLFPVGLTERFRGASSTGTYVQEGDEVMTRLGTYEVFYPERFASAPNLTFPAGTDNSEHFEVIEQRADGFKFRVSGALTSGTRLRWKAVGLKTKEPQ